MKLDPNLSFTLEGNEVALRNVDLAQTPLEKLQNRCDEHAKLVFLFDASSSMSCQIAATYTDMYLWPADVILNIRAVLNASLARINGAVAQGLPAGAAMQGDLDASALQLAKPDSSGLLILTADDEELKRLIVQFKLIDAFGIKPNWQKHDRQPPTRIDVVKQLAKQEIERRFARYPRSRIAVISFDSSPNTLFDDGTPDQLWPALEQLHAYGGTDILAAIRMGMDVCRKAPSKVGIHHFIVVSDGEDHVADHNIGQWVPALKASGVVLDYIHIGDYDANDGLKKACADLGGEFVVVSSVHDLEKKFIAAVGRKLLASAAA